MGEHSRLEEVEAGEGDSTNETSGSLMRRSILKLAGIGTVSATGLAGVASADSEIDIRFNPKNDKEVLKFAEEFRNLSNKRRKEVLSKLSDEQLTALKKAFAPYRTEVRTKSVAPTSSAVITQDVPVGEATKTVTVSGYSYLGNHLWDWPHRVNWSYDGVSVSDILSNSYADVYDTTWSYDGNTSQSVDDEGTAFVAFRQGHLSWVGGDVIANANPYARIKGTADGTSIVISKSDGY